MPLAKIQFLSYAKKGMLHATYLLTLRFVNESYDRRRVSSLRD